MSEVKPQRTIVLGSESARIVLDRCDFSRTMQNAEPNAELRYS